MIRLIEAAPGALRSRLPAGRDPALWHAALTGEIAQHLSAAHAQILARPERIDGGMAWLADGAARSRSADLDWDGRRALDAAAGAILSDIRRLAESGAAPAVREAWPALREIPDMGHLFAVDGRPVLAAWGHSGDGAAGRLARFDDGVPWRAAPRPAWGRYGTALGVLAALALAAGLLLPLAASWFVDRPAACMIVPGQLDAMRGQLELDSRGQELRTLLATLTEDIGRRQLLCPVAVLPPAPTPEPRPPARADLPQEKWDRQDLSMLQGCWHLNTSLQAQDRMGNLSPFKAWRMCFDGAGHGNQEVMLQNARRCSGPLEAAFDGERLLKVTPPQPCSGPELTMSQAELQCRRLSDVEAQCSGRNPSGTTFQGTFKR